MKKTLLIILVLLFSSATYSQLSVVQGTALGQNPLQLIQTQLIGQGITVLNASFNDVPGNITSNQIGSFTALNEAYQQLGVSAGLIMSSGTAIGAIGPNSSGGFTGSIPSGAGDEDLTVIASAPTHDGAVLQFDFIPMSDTLRFNYVFASEEFPEYCYDYNDAFGFFLSGPGINGTFTNQSDNIALMPNGISYVTINNICDSASVRWDNSGGLYYQYDQFTIVFTAWHIVQPCQVYHIKLAVADAGDWSFDSGVFLEKNSFSASGFTVNNSFSVPSLGLRSIEGCSDATISFHLPEIALQNDTILYTISGTATNGVDFPAIPQNYVVIPAGEDSINIIIQPYFDNIPEGIEVLVLTIPMVTCSGSTLYTDSIFIYDNTPILPNFTPDTSACEGSFIQLNAMGQGGQLPYRYLWNTGWTKGILDLITLPGINDYIVRVRDACMDSIIDTISVTGVLQPIITNLQSVFSICDSSITSILLQSTDPASTFSWTASGPSGNLSGYSAGTGSSILQQLHNSGVTIDTVYYTVTAFSLSCNGPQKVFKVAVRPNPSVISTPPQQTICTGQQTNLVFTSNVTGSTFSWNYSYSSLNLSGAVSGTGNLIQQTILNSGNTIDTVFYYTVASANSCMGDTSIFKVIVHPPPIPIITGLPTACVGVQNTFSTQPGMSAYDWTVVPDGTITGAGTNSITISWPSAGVKTISINYINSAGCIASLPSTLSVMVNPLPVINVTGPLSPCLNSSGNLYTSAAGMTNYTWNISSGGSITSGGTFTDPQITVTWNTIGNQSTSVNYTDANGCIAASPFNYTVNVLALPVPGISGLASVCNQTTGVIYSTETGKTGYNWQITGGSITAGGTPSDNTATVTWTAPGAGSISVSYTDANGCTSASPTVYPVNVKPLPDVSNNPLFGQICSGNNTNIVLTSNVSGTAYAWTCTPSSANITGYIAGNGLIINNILTNLGLNPEWVTYHITPTANSCTGSVTDFIMNISEVPDVYFNPPTQTICSQLNCNINLLSNVNGTTFTWTASGTSANVSGYSNGNGLLISQQLTNSGNNFETVFYNVTPTAFGCPPGIPMQVLVIVNPKPAVTNAITQHQICSGTATNIQLTSTQTGTTFIWNASASSGNLSGFSNGSVPVIAQIINNSGFNNEIVTYSVTPTANSCDGDPLDFNVTIFPVADVVITPISQSLCTGSTTSLTISSNVAGSSFIWIATGSSPYVSGYSSGSGNIIQQTLFNIGYLIEIATYNITPIANSCSGTPREVRVNVYPNPMVTTSGCFDQITTTDGAPIKLTGAIPSGGTWSGTGVSGGIFNPVIAGAGTHILTYSYSNTWTCNNQSIQTITVIVPVPFICGSSIIDIRDNYSYPTVLIGTQCWMASNLNYGNNVADNVMQRDNCIVEKYCFLNNAANCDTRGGLYQWDEMMYYDQQSSKQGVCPPSWHIPSEAEWNTLFVQYINNGFAGSPLKSTGFSGFNAHFFGDRFDNRQWDFDTFATLIWSSSSHGSFKAWAHGLNFYNPSVSFYPTNRSNAFSVRCIKD